MYIISMLRNWSVKGMITVAIIFVFLGLASYSYAVNYFPLTASQKHFTAIVRDLPGVVSVKWETPVSFWVKVSSKSVGSPPNRKKANTLAEILAERGRTALYQPFCVHIYQSKKNELGNHCVY